MGGGGKRQVHVTYLKTRFETQNKMSHNIRDCGRGPANLNFNAT
jgi:hypothetical protein